MNKKDNKERKIGILVGCLSILTSVMLFICSPARIDGEFNMLSFFFCASPIIVGLPCWFLE